MYGLAAPPMLVSRGERFTLVEALETEGVALVDLLCSPNAHARPIVFLECRCSSNARSWRSIQRRPKEKRASLEGPSYASSNTAYPSPWEKSASRRAQGWAGENSEQNARPCIHRKSQRRHIHIHMERKNKRAWRDHFERKKRDHPTFIALVGSASEGFVL